MDYDILNGDTQSEKVTYYTIGDLIELAKKYNSKVFRFLGTDYHPKDIISWRGSYCIPAIDYGTETIIGGALAESLSSGLTKTHTGWKGGDYQYESGDEFYIANEGRCGGMHKVVGYENGDFEIILLTRIDEY